MTATTPSRRTLTTVPSVVGEIEPFLQTVIGQLDPEPATPPGRGRPRILPAVALWSGLVVCLARGFSSQLALWRLLSQTRLWDYPRFAVSDQAVYARLAQGGRAPLEHLFTQVTALLATRLDPLLPAPPQRLAPFASDVVAVDATTLDPVARQLAGVGNDPPAGRRLPGKLGTVFDLRRQQWRQLVWVHDTDQNEKVTACTLVDGLGRGTLILADLGYFGFRWFDDLTDAGYWWVSRLREKTSYEVVAVLAQHGETLDALVWLGAHRADRAAHLVRLVQFRQGGVLRRYVTNVRDPQRLPAAEVAHLYARRWDIELAIKLVKRELGCHLWWSTKDVVIQQQLLGALILSQIVLALRLEVAARAEVDLFDVSLPLLLRYLPQFAAHGEDPLAAFLRGGRAAGFIRPARRVVIEAPDPPLLHACSIHPVPICPTPRYASRRCDPPTTLVKGISWN